MYYLQSFIFEGFFLFICEAKRKKPSQRKKKHAIVLIILTSFGWVFYFGLRPISSASQTRFAQTVLGNMWACAKHNSEHKRFGFSRKKNTAERSEDVEDDDVLSFSLLHFLFLCLVNKEKESGNMKIIIIIRIKLKLPIIHFM